MYFVVFFLIFLSLFMCLFMTFYMFILDDLVMVLEFILMSSQVMEFKVYFYMDWISSLFLMVVCMISLWTFLYSKSYMGEEKNQMMFLILTGLFVMSMFLMVLSMNMWMILLGWDGLGIISYLLVIFYQSEMSNYSGMITVMTNRLGDVGMILSIFLMMNCSSFDIMIYSEKSGMIFFLIFLMVGAFTKSAQFPFSAWLPLAMAAPTPISALVHSSTLVTAGVYLMIRFNFILKSSLSLVMNMLLLSLITMFMAGLVALGELDFKKIIALSTLSQLGLMMMIVLVGYEILGFFHVLTHALFKALLFLCSGIMIHEFSNNQDIRNYNMSLSNPLVVGIFSICSLSLMGVPFLSGFYSKDLILEMMYSMNFNLLVLMTVIIATMMTVLYSMRLLVFSMFLGKKGFKLMFNKKWDMMYTSIIFCFFGVLFLGSSLSWLFLEKLEMLMLTFNTKMLNMYLIGVGLLLFFYINISFYSKYMNYFLMMFYLTPVQGFWMNIIIEKTSFFVFQSENMLQLIIMENFKKFFNLVSSLVSLMKFIKYYMVFFMIFMCWFFL